MTARYVSRVARLALVLALSVVMVSVSPSAQADTVTVHITNYAFSPATATVQVGDAVTWTNQDSVSHTTTSDAGSGIVWDSGTLPKGSSYKVTFTQAGTYTYHCAFHPDMHGTIVVQGAGGPTATPTIAPTVAPTPTATAKPRRAHRTVTVKSSQHGSTYAFSPRTLKVKVGTRVTWVNHTNSPHTVTSTARQWKFNKRLPATKSVSFTFKKAGTFTYHCSLHPGMTARVVVKK